MRTTATVKVRLVVEVEVGDAWGPDCTVGQVHAQGATEARNAVERALQEHGRGAIRVVDVAADVMTLERKS